MVLAGILAIPAGTVYPAEKNERNSYWTTICNVTDCYASDPVYDKVTIQSHEYFEYNITVTVKRGCIIYPVGSLVVCYVNSKKLTIDKPGGSDGLPLVIATSIIACVGVIALIIWSGCCIHECHKQYKQAAPAQPVQPPARLKITIPSSKKSATSSIATASSPSVTVAQNNIKLGDSCEEAMDEDESSQHVGAGQ